MANPREHGVPPLHPVTFAMLGQALRRGAGDFRRAPLYGLTLALSCVLIGLAFLAISLATGKSYWMVFAAAGFPMVGPFAAIGLYEVSRRLARGEALAARPICSAIFMESRRQLPSMIAIMLFMFLLWFFIAHMIFALFLGTMTLTNIDTSLEVYLSLNGLMMLGVGTLVGAGFALILYMITVISLPLLLDREVDFVTAMITSFQIVLDNPRVMLSWAALIAAVSFLALLPAFLGLFLILPIFGHATWHLYAQITAEEGGAAP